jgi:putative ATP-grasp target RiPP
MSRTGENVSTRRPSVEGLGKFLTMGATRSYAQERFTSDPVATVSAQFSLGSPAAGNQRCDEASSAIRPWGLRDLVAAAAGTVSYDHGRQMTVLDDGSGWTARDRDDTTTLRAAVSGAPEVLYSPLTPVPGRPGADVRPTVGH